MRRMRPIPFALVAPASILLFGAAVTLASTFLGLKELASHAEQSADFRADTLARALAARLGENPTEYWGPMLQRAGTSCDCSLLAMNREKTALQIGRA